MVCLFCWAFFAHKVLVQMFTTTDVQTQHEELGQGQAIRAQQIQEIVRRELSKLASSSGTALRKGHGALTMEEQASIAGKRGCGGENCVSEGVRGRRVCPLHCVP